MNFEHKSVMPDECIENLKINPDGVYVDGTAGGGGHSVKICERLRHGRLIGIDQDKNAIAKASDTLKSYSDKITLVHDNFINIKYILDNLEIETVDGILLDLGVSSHQLDEADRGFSYMKDAPLDMRMNQEGELTAWDIVNGYTSTNLTKVMREYGEERWASRIADFIIKERSKKPIKTTFELVEVIKKAIPHSARQSGPHPAKRTFQAVRIEVNKELEILESAVCDGFDRIKTGGRMCIITFHSLEDRIIKNTFKHMVNACTCPPDFPICICGRKSVAVTKKVIIPSEDEIERNSRARSAKLRVAEKL